MASNNEDESLESSVTRHCNDARITLSADHGWHTDHCTWDDESDLLRSWSKLVILNLRFDSAVLLLCPAGGY